MSIKERLIYFIKYKKIPIKRFEEMCSLSNGYVSSMRKSLGTEKLEIVLNAFPELNRDWLLYGEGEMLQIEKKEVTLQPEGTQMELNFSKVADACQRSAATAETLAESNAKLVNQLVDTLARIEKKIDTKGGAEDAKDAVLREVRK